jgi:hypothetical protein
MHKGVICLTKATDKEDAISNVESFLESYGDGKVWDWYEIGGRWGGTLGSNGDSILLTECVAIVEEWKQDLEAEADELWDKMIEARTQEKSREDKFGMSGYFAARYSEVHHDEFCFNSNVYDIDNNTNNPEEALKVPEQYFAVMVDMHN